ncbi:MAG: HAMP domain-containing protein, partial [Sinobacteraceae bacterium]|nr:HAMP domain-containing protein [Nevskiaceae bacterium]
MRVRHRLAEAAADYPAVDRMTTVSLKLKYAGAAFAMVVCVVAAVAAVFAWQHDVGARRMHAAAEKSARDRVAVELRARAEVTAAHAADGLAPALRARDAESIAHRLQPITDDPTVVSLAVTDAAGVTVYDWQRAEKHPGALQLLAAAPVRESAEEATDAATPSTVGKLAIGLEQASATAPSSLPGRLAAASDYEAHTVLALAGGLGLLGGLAGGYLFWRTGRRVEQPIAALIRGAERIGQGDYTRPLDTWRRGELGELQRALERMRGRLRQ